MMDSYEAFFDEYIDFMKAYKDSDDVLGMAADYADYMVKYADYMKKLGEVNTDELSTADALYFAEVQTRINEKMLEVAQ